MSEETTSQTPPDRLSVNPKSEHFQVEVLKRGVGIRFKGKQRTDIEEYSISEGWVRVQAGKTVDRRGNPLTLKLTGPVEAWYEDLGDDAPVGVVSGPFIRHVENHRAHIHAGQDSSMASLSPDEPHRHRRRSE